MSDKILKSSSLNPSFPRGGIGLSSCSCLSATAWQRSRRNALRPLMQPQKEMWAGARPALGQSYMVQWAAPWACPRGATH